MQNVKSIVSKALHAGYSISVWSEDAVELKRSTNRPAILQMIDNLDWVQLIIRSGDGVKFGTVTIADNEVQDYSLSLKFLVE